MISLKTGPDGNVFMIDWYDGEQCHVRDPNRPDRSNGRIFKVSYGPAKPPQKPLRKSLSDAALVALQSDPK